MDKKILDKVEKSYLKNRPDLKVGDTVKLFIRISEGNKERTQVFQGFIISMKGSGLSKTITVRKLSGGVGVERIMPLHSPTLEKVEIIKRGSPRRSKLYYMRDRVGRQSMKIRNNEMVDIIAEEEVIEEAVEGAVESEGADDVVAEVDADVEVTEAEGDAKTEDVDAGDSADESK